MAYQNNNNNKPAVYTLLTQRFCCTHLIRYTQWVSLDIYIYIYMLLHICVPILPLKSFYYKKNSYIVITWKVFFSLSLSYCLNKVIPWQLDQMLSSTDKTSCPSHM